MHDEVQYPAVMPDKAKQLHAPVDVSVCVPAFAARLVHEVPTVLVRAFFCCTQNPRSAWQTKPVPSVAQSASVLQNPWHAPKPSTVLLEMLSKMFTSAHA